MKDNLKYILVFLVLGIFIGINMASASFDVDEIAKNFNKRKKQTLFEGAIDTLIIKRDNVQIHLGPGDVTLYGFGADKPSMMFYKGTGRFTYSPPNDIEEKNLRIMTGSDIINDEFKNASFIMVNEYIAPIDTTSFKREKIKERDWRDVTRFNQELAEYLGFNPHIRIFGEILSGEPASCFLARFEIKDIGKIVYCEDPVCDDYCRIYRYTEKGKPPDILAGYSTDGLSPKQRGYISVDIIHYDISARISGIGKIDGDCRIHFKPLRGGPQFIYFDLSKELTISSVKDSAGEYLPAFSWEGSPGFGVWLNQPMQIGQEYQIAVEYEGSPLIFEWEIFFSDDKNPWYPKNLYPDRALFDIKMDYPSNFSVAHGGEPTEQFSAYLDNFKYLRTKAEAEWSHSNETGDVFFCVGDLRSFLARPKEQYYLHMFIPGLKDWGIELPQTIITSYWTEISITMTDIEWFEESANETARILILLDRILDCEPNLVTSVIEYPFNNGMGSPGLVCLSSYLEESARHRSRFTRAHETAHQWWGSIVGFDNYHDAWIIEGLAEYMALMTDYDPLEPKDKPDSILSAWRDSILVAGTDGLLITMGSRLTNSVYDHYKNLVVTKGAYIFHMIRYMLYDFNQDSDRYFLKFLREIVDTYKWKSITTDGLQKILQKYIGTETDWFFDQWVHSTEIPRYSVSYSFAPVADSSYSVNLMVKQENVPPEFKMIVPVRIDMADDYYVIHKLMIDKPDNEINIEELPYRPENLTFNIENAVLCKVDYD